MNPVAADVSPLHLIQSNVRADSRRLLRFRGSRREKMFRGILSPPSDGAERENHRPVALQTLWRFDLRRLCLFAAIPAAEFRISVIMVSHCQEKHTGPSPFAGCISIFVRVPVWLSLTPRNSRVLIRRNCLEKKSVSIRTAIEKLKPTC